MATQEFDFVVFGATGFTGKHVVEELVRVSQKEEEAGHATLKWAVAGRSASKLRLVLDEVSIVTGRDVRGVTVIEADVERRKSLDEMCRRTTILLNCVGPYYKFGEPVVKACIENGAHQLDISGEAMFSEAVQLKYHDEAQKAKVYVVGSCGFDSIPSEIAVQLIQENFAGDVNSVEGFLQLISGSEGLSFNSGTWKSMIGGVTMMSELKPLHKKLLKDPVPTTIHPLKARGLLSYTKEVKSWLLPMPYIDPPVVRRTQYFNYHHRRLRPVRQCILKVTLHCYSVCSLWMAVIMVLCHFILRIMTCFGFGSRLLSKYPSVFSLGTFTDTGPSRKQMESTSFVFTFIGYGYSEKLSSPEQQHEKSPDKKLKVTVSGPEPGYVTTPICLIQAALCVLREKDKLPVGGGVFSPGAAFWDTTLKERLASNGLQFAMCIPASNEF